MQLHAYVPTLYVGPPASGTLTAVPAGLVNWTATNFENFSMFKVFSGFQPVMLQWYPDDDEVYVENASEYAANTHSQSGFAGIMGGGNGSSTFHIELDYGIEYVPSITFRPFVDRKLPEVNPDATYFLTHYIQKHWDECVITTVEQYDKLTASYDHLPSAWSERYQMANTVGIPSNKLPLRVFEEAKKDAGICEMIIDKTGYDVCGAVGEGFERVSSNAMQRAIKVAGAAAFGLYGSNPQQQLQI
jgi:hypothetical protein